MRDPDAKICDVTAVQGFRHVWLQRYYKDIE